MTNHPAHQKPNGETETGGETKAKDESSTKKTDEEKKKSGSA